MTKVTYKTNTLKKQLIESLEKTLGIITTACKIVKINRSTFYDWYNKDKIFKKQVDSIGDIALDFAETQLHKQIRDGNPTSTIFYLKTKGKRRGYIERLETSGPDGGPVQHENLTIDVKAPFKKIDED